MIYTAQEIYRILLAAYGYPQWWSDNPYQVMVEAVLVQHTTWGSVKKLRPALAQTLIPAIIQAMSQEELELLIRPCGFQKAKSNTIKTLTEWFIQYDCDEQVICTRSLPQLREELLALRGIGTETADVILVYAFHRPSFIVDAYTRTFLKRLGYSFVNDAEFKSFFEQERGPSAERYGNLHWLILEHCIARCKKKPLCEGCPFSNCPLNAEDLPHYGEGVESQRESHNNMV